MSGAAAPDTAKRFRTLAIALTCLLIFAPVAAYVLFHVLYDGELFKDYHILSEIGRCGEQIKTASSVIYVWAWGLAILLFWDSCRKGGG